MGNIFRIDDQVAVVVGGTGGIGEALAMGLAEFGAKVVIAGRNMDKGGVLVNNINSRFAQSQAVALAVDISDESSINQLKDKVEQPNQKTNCRYKQT